MKSTTRKRAAASLALGLALAALTAAPLRAENRELPPTDAIAWAMGTKFATATWIYKSGQYRLEVLETLDDVAVLAEHLGVPSPPALPAHSEKPDFVAQLLRYQIDYCEAVSNELAARHGMREGLLFETAVKSAVLGILYAPEDELARNVAATIAVNADRLGLPREAWVPLVGVVADGGSFEDLKARIFETHQAVAAHLDRA